MTSDGRYYIEKSYGFLDQIYTFVIFILSCFSITFMGTSCLLINFVRESWLNLLEKRFPDLEFIRKTTLRSTVDTHRNMGIITVLVTIKGNYDPSFIKRRLMEDVLEKKQNDGWYVYRHLRMTLTTRWGWYAWQKLVPFDIDNHLIFANSFYRGRPISDMNIQEYVSETVSKYLVPDLPPWQITVFQNLAVEKYYMLIRFHHMLLSQEGIDLESILSLGENKKEIVSCAPDITKLDPFERSTQSRRSNPFQELYKIPKALPVLWEKIYEAFTNTWNEFISFYDPTENPSILKKPGMKTIAAIFLIASVAILRQLTSNRSLNIKMISNICRQKEISFPLIFWSLWNSLNPLSVLIFLSKAAVNTFVFSVIKLPLLLACELRSLWMLNDEKYLDSSYMKTIIVVWTILKDSLKEVVYYWKLFYTGPKIILEELFLPNKHCSHQLQFLSLCGRKVVAWSNAVPLEKIQEIQDVTGASISEILITATSASLRDLLVQYSLDIPDSILTTARYFPQEELIRSHNKDLSACGSGILCLPLPIRNPFGLDFDPVTELRAVQQIILRARLRQPALYLASLSQIEYGIFTQVLPSPILRLILNMLSRRFPVVLNEIAPSKTGEFKKRYIWGQEVDDLMYWSPPQANLCMTLTLMVFGDCVRLGVIADALLSPHHTIITSMFAQHIWELAAASGVTTNYGNYSFVSDTETSDTSHSSQNSTLSSSSLDLDVDERHSDDENNLNQGKTSRKYTLKKKLQFNIPMK